ncbi:hypothetical protein BAUCODRAFT_334459 [Baudoinia panamericana UAMH 10762]|uniref:Uncharacterized protein n=1 Tax=Baudoinia panamericana (strain UAMH 10762) TaxID=717646 RepID=M2MX56_BAUPA|nr:uncharacterized protein BAUCODRAFT_334459 [Baudoinia panamericana UAMH 10762]EMC90835.1 hypothetical protein BAUCODRAFT_334459 [Baudoinia panamericana UAMH 10762]
MAPTLNYVFSLHVNLAPPVDLGPLSAGHRRYIPITGGSIKGTRLEGIILPGGGDWNDAQVDGSYHMRAEYVLQANDGTSIFIHNEGDARNDASSGWYARTVAKFDVKEGPHAWLKKSLIIGEQLPPPPSLAFVEFNFYEVL